MPASQPTDEYAALANAILRAAREIGLRGYRNPETVQLSQTNIVVLRNIELNPGTNPSEAARNTGLRRSNFSTALNELVATGFVERRVDPEDGRSVRLFVTAKMLKNFRLVQEEWIACMREGLGEDVAVAHATTLLNNLSEGLTESRLELVDGKKKDAGIAAASR